MIYATQTSTMYKYSPALPTQTTLLLESSTARTRRGGVFLVFIGAVVVLAVMPPKKKKKTLHPNHTLNPVHVTVPFRRLRSSPETTRADVP